MMDTPKLEIEEAPHVTEEEFDRMVDRTRVLRPATPEQVQKAREFLAARAQKKS